MRDITLFPTCLSIYPIYISIYPLYLYYTINLLFIIFSTSTSFSHLCLPSFPFFYYLLATIIPIGNSRLLIFLTSLSTIISQLFLLFLLPISYYIPSELFHIPKGVSFPTSDPFFPLFLFPHWQLYLFSPHSTRLWLNVYSFSHILFTNLRIYLI